MSCAVTQYSGINSTKDPKKIIEHYVRQWNLNSPYIGIAGRKRNIPKDFICTSMRSSIFFVAAWGQGRTKRDKQGNLLRLKKYIEDPAP